MATGKEIPPLPAPKRRAGGGISLTGQSLCLLNPPRECIFMIRTWQERVIEYRCDKVRFQYKYVLSTLLVIIRVDSITNYVLSTYL